MADIELRFHRDMLVLSSPITAVLARQGFSTEQDVEYVTLIEPEIVSGAFRLNKLAGVQCLVANTADITPARLEKRSLERRASEVLATGMKFVQELKPQHILLEIGPCGRPLNACDETSLNEHRNQYASAARCCANYAFDAFFLNGFNNLTDLKCALMGIRQVSAAPLFASVCVGGNGVLFDGSTFKDAVRVMEEYGASVVGFETSAELVRAKELARCAREVTSLPLLAQLVVKLNNPKQGEPTRENPYYCPDVMMDAGLELRSAGVQFLRAVGVATPAYAGALVAVSEGRDVFRPDIKL